MILKLNASYLHDVKISAADTGVGNLDEYLVVAGFGYRSTLERQAFLGRVETQKLHRVGSHATHWILHLA